MVLKGTVCPPSLPLLLSYVRFFALSVIETYPENIALHIFRVPTFFRLKQCSGSGSAWIHIDFGRLDPDPDPGRQKFSTKI